MAQASGTKTRIDHVNVVVSDLERSARFYESVFGLQRGFSAVLEGAWIETVTALPGARAQCLFLESPQGGARIELIRYFTPEGEHFGPNALANTHGLRHLAFEVDNIDATLEKVRAHGIEPLSSPIEVPFRVANLGTKRLAYFHDPDGTLLEAASYDSQ